MHMFHDPDEYDMVSSHRACTACKGDNRKCNGMCNGLSGYSLVRRTPEKIAKVKADKLRRHEDDILALADAIRARHS